MAAEARWRELARLLPAQYAADPRDPRGADPDIRAAFGRAFQPVQSALLLRCGWALLLGRGLLYRRPGGGRPHRRASGTYHVRAAGVAIIDDRAQRLRAVAGGSGRDFCSPPFSAAFPAPKQLLTPLVSTLSRHIGSRRPRHSRTPPSLSPGRFRTRSPDIAAWCYDLHHRAIGGTASAGEPDFCAPKGAAANFQAVRSIRPPNLK
jgi:hypothetical protein